MLGQSWIGLARQRVALAACAVALSSSVSAAPQHRSHAADAFGTLIVRVRLHVDRSIRPRHIVDHLEDETASLWRPYGVQIEWADGPASEADANAFSVDALVERSLLSKRVRVLGTAQIALDTPASPIHVSIDATEGVLATRPSAVAQDIQMVHDAELARALGRVLAHELGHVLLALPAHAPTGLMGRSFAPADLATSDQQRFRLTPNDVARLRSRVRMLSLEVCDF